MEPSIYTQTDRHTDRQTERQTDRHRLMSFLLHLLFQLNKQTNTTNLTEYITDLSEHLQCQTDSSLSVCLSVCLCGAAICQQQTDDSLCRYIHTFGTQLYKSRGLMLQQSSIRQHPSTLNRCLLYCTTVHARCVGIAR